MYKLVIQKGELITLHLLCSFLGLTFLCFHHYFRHILFQKSADLPVFAIISHLCKRFSQHLKPKKGGNKIAMIAEIVATFACEKCKKIKIFWKSLRKCLSFSSLLSYYIFLKGVLYIHTSKKTILPPPPQKKTQQWSHATCNIQRYVYWKKHHGFQQQAVVEQYLLFKTQILTTQLHN